MKAACHYDVALSIAGRAGYWFPRCFVIVVKIMKGE
jgi:hypothetical protein